MGAENPSLQATTDELLQRILTAVEPAKPKRGFEVACAVVLALATTSLAGCACQSKLWGGAQMARGNAAVAAARQASNNYALLAVMFFAAVLVFGGIARAFDSHRLRAVLAALAVVLFLATAAGLLTMPICHE
jgi:hypothetical protein